MSSEGRDLVILFPISWAGTASCSRAFPGNAGMAPEPGLEHLAVSCRILGMSGFQLNSDPEFPRFMEGWKFHWAFARCSWWLFQVELDLRWIFPRSPGSGSVWSPERLSVVFQFQTHLYSIGSVMKRATAAFT